MPSTRSPFRIAAAALACGLVLGSGAAVAQQPAAAPPPAAKPAPVAAVQPPPTAKQPGATQQPTTVKQPAAVQQVAPCNAPADLSRLDQPLVRVAGRLAAGLPITIIAIGSSSTAGAGATSLAASYPSRLEIELTQRFPAATIRVLNRGVNGEEAADMLARLDRSLEEKPDLVLWQIGTNAVLRDHNIDVAGALIRMGIARMRDTGADVVLIDPQFAPKVLAKPEAQHMVDVIASTAKSENVDLFHRFAVMRNWREAQRLPFEAFTSPDGLHMNDWSYACVAKLLSASIVEAVTRQAAVAGAASGQY
jgi:lysophospholipase L1-like esterase